MDPIYGLLITIMILGVAVAMLVVSNLDIGRRNQELQLESLQLHKQNARLSWDNEMLHAEIKCIAVTYDIKSLPFRAPSRRPDHG